MRMTIVYFLMSVFFGILYGVELVCYHIHNLEWLLLFMFFCVMEKIEELKY